MTSCYDGLVMFDPPPIADGNDAIAMVKVHWIWTVTTVTTVTNA